MIEGFNELHENINTTIKLIDNVSQASKEQSLAISQISSTIGELDLATQKNASLASEISNMASHTSQFVSQLSLAVNQTSFDKTAHKRICDTSMIVKINKLKSDHIKLQNDSLAKCKKGVHFNIISATDCELGLWIANNEGKSFTKTKEWEELKNAHNKVHQYIQETIDLYSKNSSNSEIFKATNKIEENTVKLFNLLDIVREINCKG